MPGTPANFISKFHRAISDFQRDPYALQGEPGLIFGAQGDSVVLAEQSVVPQGIVEEKVEMQATREHHGQVQALTTEQSIPTAPHQKRPVAEAKSDKVVQCRLQEGAAPPSQGLVPASGETSDNPEPRLNWTNQSQEWEMAPAVVAYKKKPTEIFESQTSARADSPQPQPASTVPEVIAAVKTVEAVATSSNGDQGPRYSKSAVTTAGHLQKVPGVCESKPVVARTVSTLTTALPPDGTDKAESKNSNAAEALTDNIQRPQEGKLPTPVASSPRADATSKAAETHAEPIARPQGIGSGKESTDAKQLPKELARTTEGPKVPAIPVHHREPTAIDIQKLAPPDVVELRPDPQYPCVLDRSMAVGPESFSILRSRLLNVHASQGTKTVLITSAETEEGKSLITMNLAMSLGLLGQKRILLVDGDLRKRRVTETLNLHQTQGLSDFLEGTTPFSKVVRATSVSMLFVVSAGHIADGVLPEILEGPRWREFLDTAKEQFDLVLIDSVPSGAPLADFELLMAPCDAALMVVRMRKTTREGLVRAMQRIDEKRLLGIVLNNSDHIERYKYDGYYGHGKGTGSSLGRG